MPLATSLTGCPSCAPIEQTSLRAHRAGAGDARMPRKAAEDDMLVTRTQPTETFVFIYRVRSMTAAADQSRYCTVLSLAARFRDAEQIAINCVHQHGYHILRTDTAAKLPPDELSRYPEGAGDAEELRRFGTVFHLA